MSLPKILRVVSCLLLASAFTYAHPQDVQPEQTVQPELIKPSEADSSIEKFDDANVIVRPRKMDGAPILVFLPGTGGRPEGPKLLLQVAAEQGYRVIGLEYNDTPAVGEVCPTVPSPTCAEKFRAMRIWGTVGSPDVSNSVQEGIVPRLIALLQLLAKRHPEEKWDTYLTPDNKPVWSKIAVSGQSQGAGMAAFIAKKESVLRVVLFSSPVDSTKGPENIQLPAWLSWPSATPPDRWYAERNSREPFNAGLIQSYPALGVPADHIRVNTLDLPPAKAALAKTNPMVYHGINIMDQRYIPEWRFLFGTATSK